MGSQDKALIRRKKKDLTPVSVRGPVTTRRSSADASSDADSLLESRKTRQKLDLILKELKYLNFQLEDIRQ
jgi:hypothetical protein